MFRLLAALVVFNTSYEKMRMGRIHDGGYVVAKGLTYDHCIGGGISDDNSFEYHFLELHHNLSCDVYDHSIKYLPVPHPRMFLHKQMIGKNSLSEQLNRYKNIMIKMDVEGGEYDWILSLNNNQLRSIAQLVIEFHPYFGNKMWDTLKLLSKTHYLIHFHGNNYQGVQKFDNITIPKVFECTYIRKDLEDALPSYNTLPIPMELDMPNNKHVDDIYIDWPPFVYRRP